MPLWGTEDTAAAKPQIGGRSQNAINARDIFATVAGWSQVGAGRNTTGKQHELLVAMRGLSTVLIGGTGQTACTGAQVKASVTSMNWNITTFDKSAGGTLSVTVNYNEAIDVATGGGTPTIVVTNDQRANHTLSYASGTGTNRLTFTLVIAAANAATNAGDILSVAAQNVAKNGGTIKDAGASTNAQIAISAGHGTATGTVTVVA